MERTRAWELLNDPNYCGQLTMEGVYRLVLRAGYGKVAARTAAKQRGWERLCAGDMV